MSDKLKVAEFYSGIGGMHYALRSAGIESDVLAAFDINDIANIVYRHNFPDVKIRQRNIEAMPQSFFDALKADMWTMSPPCQPYTRQGKQMGSDDPRAKSFLFLIDGLAKLAVKPKYLLMENVAGFEVRHSYEESKKSSTRNILVNQIAKLGYSFEEYILNPIQIGYPNSRTRYYFLAKLKNGPQSQDHVASDDLYTNPAPKFKYVIPGVNMDAPEIGESDEVPNFEKSVWNDSHVRSISEFMESDLDVSKSNSDKKPWGDYSIDSKLLEKRGWVFDVVGPESKRSCCFTKSYSKYAEGTGSVLQMEGKIEPGAQTITNTRYFTEREVANLMGFPADFQFPSNVSLAQRYKLLGNSLNVSVVAKLMAYMVGRM